LSDLERSNASHARRQMKSPAEITLKRAYDTPAPGDGTRVLVERLWPRGVSKAGAAIDHWAKDVAPSPGLRRWYGHRAELWPEFRRRYEAELEANAGAVEALRRLCAGAHVTFVFAARDREHSSAVVLRDFLLRASRNRHPG
jgi:uncharacterized protein YeaO (DUF488 family)